MGKLRIIGGINRSRVITFQDNLLGLRPTPDRVRETLFNWLGQDLNGKTCLDLFAGSGALSFESASRGAKQVVTVEVNPKVVADLNKNKVLLKSDQISIVRADALLYLKNSETAFDVIFLDPPYNSELLQQSLELLLVANCVKQHGIIYIEYQIEPDLSQYQIIKQGKASKVNYALIKLSKN